MGRRKYLTLKEQVKICKENGFKFRYIYRSEYNQTAIRMDYMPDDWRSEISLKRTIKFTKDSLIEKLDQIKMIAHLRIIQDEIYESNRRAKFRRKSFKVVSGGMAWCPTGIKTGEPKGKLKLVA